MPVLVMVMSGVVVSARVKPWANACRLVMPLLLGSAKGPLMVSFVRAAPE